MKLYELLDTIKRITKTQPNMGDVFYGSVTELNERQDVEYPAAVITQDTHYINSQDEQERFGIILFGVDRLTEDKSNQQMAQDWANSMLINVIEELENMGIDVYTDGTVEVFNQRFDSLCAGAFVRATFTVDIDDCNSYELVRSINGERGDVILPAVQYVEQKLTDDEQAQSRKNINARTNGPTRVKKLAPYFSEVWYDTVDYDYANRYFDNFKMYGCSAFYKDGILSRNYDWPYSDRIGFLVHTPAVNGRYGSIGMSGYIEGLTDTETEIEKYNILPYIMCDGMNEKGLSAAVLVCESKGEVRTTGTNPDKPDMNALFIVRYVLDNHTDAYEAAEDICNNWNVYMPNTQTVNEELHFIITDNVQSIVLEFKNNTCVILEDKYIVTNFKLVDTQYDEDNHIIYNSVRPYGQGLERYNCIVDEYDTLTNIDKRAALCQAIKYTLAYDTANEWYTEFTGIKDELTVQAAEETPEIFEDTMESAHEKFLHRDRTQPETWQTCHTVIYDNNSLEAFIYVQENYATRHYFKLDKDVTRNEVVEIVENYTYDKDTIDDTLLGFVKKTGTFADYTYNFDWHGQSHDGIHIEGPQEMFGVLGFDRQHDSMYINCNKGIQIIGGENDNGVYVGSDDEYLYLNDRNAGGSKLASASKLTIEGHSETEFVGGDVNFNNNGDVKVNGNKVLTGDTTQLVTTSKNVIGAINELAAFSPDNYVRKSGTSTSPIVKKFEFKNTSSDFGFNAYDSTNTKILGITYDNVSQSFPFLSIKSNLENIIDAGGITLHSDFNVQSQRGSQYTGMQASGNILDLFHFTNLGKNEIVFRDDSAGSGILVRTKKGKFTYNDEEVLVGDVNDLHTTSKTIVGAINEIYDLLTNR